MLKLQFETLANDYSLSQWIILSVNKANIKVSILGSRFRKDLRLSLISKVQRLPSYLIRFMKRYTEVAMIKIKIKIVRINMKLQ